MIRHVVIVAALLCVGCEKETAPTTDGRAVTGLSQCTVLLPGHHYLGVALPFTGSLAAKARSREHAVQLAVEQINQGGGVAGQSLGIVSCDTLKDETTGFAVVSELAGAAPMSAAVGPASSAVTLSAQVAAASGQLPLVSPSATSPEISSKGNAYLFRTAMSDAFQGKILAAIAAEAPYAYTRVVVIHRADAYGEGLASVFDTEFPGEVVKLGYDDDAANASVVVQAAQGAVGPENAVLLVSYVTDAAAIINAAEAIGWRPHWLFSDGVKDPGLVAQLTAPEQLEGSIGTSPAALTGPHFDAFRSAYVARWSEEPLNFSANAYDAAWLIAIAMALAGDPDDGAAVRAGLDATHSGAPFSPGDWATTFGAGATVAEVDYQGASGPVDFANGDVIADIELWAFTGGNIAPVACYDRHGEPCD